mmetsp:Transcript_2333/g.5368  ORF Transcript_2333/g.5368 Transcript_2333/m.5368 type:complete len:580 (+) Transcript_2333:255-1994(+)
MSTSYTDHDGIVVISSSIEENGRRTPVHARSTSASFPGGRPRRKRGRRQTARRGRQQQQQQQSTNGQTVKIVAILLSAALSLCWMVACILVFHQDSPAPHSLHDLRHPLGNLRHDFEVYRDNIIKKQKEKEKKEEDKRETDVGRGGVDGFADGAGKANSPQQKGRHEHDMSMSGIKTSEMIMDSPLVVFTFRRADYLRRTLTAILDHHPMNKSNHKAGGGRSIGLPIVLSQDGDHAEVKAVINEFMKKFHAAGMPALHIRHPKTAKGKLRGTDAYKALAVHFGWALRRIFSGDVYKEGNVLSSGYDSSSLPLPGRVIILEEDIEVAPDFFSFMHATAPLLDSDPTLLAVSAFNDNGKEGIVGDVSRLVRTDFFGGLGWMMPRRIWDEIGPKWPDGYWDDWLREPEQRQGRQTIRPEVSRTFHFGSEKGASYNQFGEELLDIKLDQADFVWENVDLGYLERNKFRKEYYSTVLNAQLSTWKDAMREVTQGNVRVEYRTWKEFTKKARTVVPIMTDEKAGVPRTAYETIVESRPYGAGGHLMFLSPPAQKLRENFERGKTMPIREFSETIRVVPPPEKEDK